MGIFKDPKTGLIIMMWLSFGYFFVEIIVGYITNSMAMVADSFHMLGDVAALVISFMSVKMSPKKWSKNTFGWARAEVLGALVNAVFLIALCFSITIEALKRFVDEEEIHDPKMLLITGGLGLLVNIVGLVILFEHGGSHGHSHGLSNNTHAKLTQLSAGSSHSGHSHGGGGGQAGGAAGHSHGNNGTAIGANSNSNNHSHSSTDDNENNSFMQQHTVIAPIKPVAKKPKSSSGGHGHSHGGGSGGNMNMRSVYLHVLSDALGSVIVMISASVVWLTDWKYKHMMDPALSILLVVLMLRSVWPLLRESALILLQTVPTHIQVDAIQQRLLENVDGVLAVHEFHVWQLAGDRIIASAHIRCRNLSEYMKIAEKVKEFFHNEGIHSTTIQPEFVELELQSVTDGVSTNLNISGSHDSCALDCPTTDEGCVQATCCQNNNKMPAVSPTSSPFLCRQRTITSRQSSDIESGSLLTSAIAPPSPISTPATLPLTASASHMAAGPPPAILTATTEMSAAAAATTITGIAAATTQSLSSSAIITPTSIVTNTTAASNNSPPPNSTSASAPPPTTTTTTTTSSSPSGAAVAQAPPLTSHSQSHLPVV